MKQPGSMRDQRRYTGDPSTCNGCPVLFIHSSFRTASTWLWSKLRRLDHVDAYYEVFNEQLAALTRAQALDQGPGSWLSKHPRGLPYYLEFRPALGPDGDVSPAEIAYLSGLIECSQEAGRLPVLSCTRTLGRMAGLKRALSASMRVRCCDTRRPAMP